MPQDTTNCIHKSFSPLLSYNKCISPHSFSPYSLYPLSLLLPLIQILILIFLFIPYIASSSIPLLILFPSIPLTSLYPFYFFASSYFSLPSLPTSSSFSFLLILIFLLVLSSPLILCFISFPSLTDASPSLTLFFVSSPTYHDFLSPNCFFPSPLHHTFPSFLLTPSGKPKILPTHMFFPSPTLPFPFTLHFLLKTCNTIPHFPSLITVPFPSSLALFSLQPSINFFSFPHFFLFFPFSPLVSLTY